MTETGKRQSSGWSSQRPGPKRGRGRGGGSSRGRGTSSGQGRRQQSHASSSQLSAPHGAGGKGIVPGGMDGGGDLSSSAHRESLDETQKIQDLEKKLAESATMLNDLKNETFTLKNDIIHKDNQIKYLQNENAKLEQQLRDEKQVSDGLRSLNDQLERKISSRGGGGGLHAKSFFKRLEKTMDQKYLSLACLVEKEVGKRLPSETMEVEYTTDEKKVRKWDCRMEAVTEFGIEVKNPSTGGSLIIAPLSLEKVLMSRDSFYVPSFVSNETVLRATVIEVLQAPEWVNFRTTEEVRTETVAAISTNAFMLGKIRQTISDCISERKRTSRDELFQSLQYFTLKSAHDKRRETPLFSKAEEIRRAKQKLLRDVEGSVDFSWWRTAKITELSVNGEDTVGCDTKDFELDKRAPLEDDDGESMGHSMDLSIDAAMESQEDYDASGEEPEERDMYRSEQESEHAVTCFGILRNEISKHIYTNFLGYDPYVDEDEVTATSILNVSRLDGWLTTVVMLLTETESRGGGRQKEYNVQFEKNYREATTQLIKGIYEFVKYWAPEELEVGQCEVGKERDTILNVRRTATVIVHSKEDGVYYIAVKHEWFS